MENNNEIFTNVAHVVGRVLTEPKFSWEKLGETFQEFFISVKRHSDAEDMICITVSERLLLNKNIKIDDTVEITGEFRSYNKIIDNKSKLLLHLFTRKIETVGKDVEHQNDIQLTGFICRQPIFRATPFGRTISDALIAINRPFTKKSDYLPAIFWGRNAEYVAKMEVGTKIKLNGRIQSRSYKKVLEDGCTVPKTAFEVSVCNVSLLEMPQKINENCETLETGKSIG